MGTLIHQGVTVGGGASAISELSDTNISNPQNNEVLKYDIATSKWVNGSGGGGGASALNDLTDVTISSVSDGDVLAYSASAGGWINGAGAPANPILPINPTDQTYMSTPGAIWIETA